MPLLHDELQLLLPVMKALMAVVGDVERKGREGGVGWKGVVMV